MAEPRSVDGTPAPVVELRGVTRDYGEEVITRVLHGIDFQLRPGEFAALIGPSGSGKSTLLNLIGLLDTPSAGEILINGQVTRGMTDEQRTRLRGRTIGFVFQFHHLLPAFTAQENVFMPLLAERGQLDRAMKQRAAELLERVGLADRRAYRANQLSGGQQQRVAIARALANNPLLVLADEPTGNLDTYAADQIFALLREINRTEGTAFLIVTHDPRMAERCDRIVELVDGRIVRDEE